jgi:hypothetical protein
MRPASPFSMALRAETTSSGSVKLWFERRKARLRVRVGDAMAPTEHRQNGIFVFDKSCSPERASCESVGGILGQDE